MWIYLWLNQIEKNKYVQTSKIVLFPVECLGLIVYGGDSNIIHDALTASLL